MEMSYQRGTSFNFSLRGAAELSESVIPLDDLIPELPSRLAAPADMRTPAYIAPYNEVVAVIVRDLASRVNGLHAVARYITIITEVRAGH